MGAEQRVAGAILPQHMQILCREAKMRIVLPDLSCDGSF
jgi:hypothetical protein